MEKLLEAAKAMEEARALQNERAALAAAAVMPRLAPNASSTAASLLQNSLLEQAMLRQQLAIAAAPADSLTQLALLSFQLNARAQAKVKADQLAALMPSLVAAERTADSLLLNHLRTSRPELFTANAPVFGGKVHSSYLQLLTRAKETELFSKVQEDSEAKKRSEPDVTELIKVLNGSDDSLSENSKENPSGRVIKRKTKREQFPEKLYRILEELEQEGKDTIISFVNEGTAFEIHQPEEFEDQIIPRYFRQGGISSFKKQLHLYGFTKIKTDSRGFATSLIFCHSKFQRGQPQLCLLMDRVNKNIGRARAAKASDRVVAREKSCLPL